MTVAELNVRMDSAEFVDWMAFYMLEAQDLERAQKKAEHEARARRRR